MNFKSNGAAADTTTPYEEYSQHDKGTNSRHINPEFDLNSLSNLDEHIEDVKNFQVNDTGYFLVKPANQWMQESSLRAIPKMLFGEFWLENELCILFADTNLGKSILAVQIGNSISGGNAVLGLKLEASRQAVLYYDFELSDKQFEVRYSDNYKNHYGFDSNFFRAEINPDMVLPEGISDFEEYLYYSIEKSIHDTGAKVLIIDNITYLKNETERAKDALPLMKLLKALKRKHGLSILALAHTPKRDMTKPITRNDLQGSKMLINFCDSAFTIGESHSDKNARYLKQIKQRNTENIYDAENVCHCEIVKQTHILGFQFIGFCSERDHLKVFTEQDRDEKIQQVKDLISKGKSQREISRELKISVGAVNKYSKL